MIDLFDPRLPEQKLHRSFMMIRSDPSYAEVMPVIQNWATGLLDRKGESDKLVKEFQSTFNSSMWEIYLNKALLDLGCSIDYSKASPDFFVTAPGKYEFNIEAVITDQLSSAKSLYSDDEQRRTHGALKLIGKIRDKVEIFRGSHGKRHPYSSLSHVQGRPFLIAVAPFDSDVSLAQNNELINLVLFGIGPPVLRGPSFGEQGRVRSLMKSSGASVDVGIFTNDSFKEISAVIFSTVGTFGKAVVESKIERLIRSTRYRVINEDEVQLGAKTWQLGTHRYKLEGLSYLVASRLKFGSQIAGSDMHIQHSSLHRETHLDGLHVYHNPYAEIPFGPPTKWPAEITENYYDVEADQPIQVHPDGALVSRQVFAMTRPSLHLLLKGYGFL